MTVKARVRWILRKIFKPKPPKGPPLTSQQLYERLQPVIAREWGKNPHVSVMFTAVRPRAKKT